MIFASVARVLNSKSVFAPVCDALKNKLSVASGSIRVHYKESKAELFRSFQLWPLMAHP